MLPLLKHSLHKEFKLTSLMKISGCSGCIWYGKQLNNMTILLVGKVVSVPKHTELCGSKSYIITL
jgi:hypothetical protein